MKFSSFFFLIPLAVILLAGNVWAQLDFNKDLQNNTQFPINDLEIVLNGHETIIDHYNGFPWDWHFQNFTINNDQFGNSVLRWSSSQFGGSAPSPIPPGGVVHVGFSVAESTALIKSMCFTQDSVKVGPVTQVAVSPVSGHAGNIFISNDLDESCGPRGQYFVGNVIVEYFTAHVPLSQLNNAGQRPYIRRDTVAMGPIPLPRMQGPIELPLPQPPSGSRYVLWIFDVDTQPLLQSPDRSRDFLEFQLASGCIGGTKFNDLNGNGQWDGGERGLQGWIINIAGPVNMSVVTDTGGHYFFGNLPIGYYHISEVMQPGWICSYPPQSFFDVFVYAGGNIFAKDFGNYRASRIYGVKYNDLNGNGMQDPGEAGLPGWEIICFDSTRHLTYRETTDVIGRYSFENLGMGIYRVSETNKPGWEQTEPASAGGFVVSITTENDAEELRFGNFQNACVSGVKYWDFTRNGVRDPGDDGLPGWTIYLTGGAGGLRRAVTDSAGNYSFCDLGPGQYTVSESLKTGWLASCDTSYTFYPMSGSNTIHNFCNYREKDTVKYRTFSSYDWMAAAQKKAIKKPRVRHPGNGVPNLVNAITELLKSIAGNSEQQLHVGVPGLYYPDNRHKRPYILPRYARDVLTTFWHKGNYHSDLIHRGLDLYNNWKLITGKLGSLPADKQNNDCVEDMLGLACNLAFSDYGFTPAGLGDLVYYNPGNPLHGMTVREIKDYGDQLMTIWDFHPVSDFQNLSDVTSSINNAFSCGPPTFDCQWEVRLDTVYWMGHDYMKIAGRYPVLEIPFLRANPNTQRYAVPLLTPLVEVPAKYELYQNYPNPFNPTTTIQFNLMDASLVSLKVYNPLGQEVANLIDRQEMEEGIQEVEFDASNLPSGVYFYRIEATGTNDASIGFKQVKKMMLLK